MPFFFFFCPLLFRNNGELGAKKIFYGPSTAYAIQLFVAIKGHFSGLFFFWISRCKGEFPRDWLYKCNTCYIYNNMQQTLINVEKHVQTVKSLVSERKTLASMFYFEQVFVFCMLINKNVLEWFLLIHVFFLIRNQWKDIELKVLNFIVILVLKISNLVS